MLESPTGIRQLGLCRQLHRHAMAKDRNTSPAEQAQAGDQVTAPELTNAEIVASTKMPIITVDGDDIINVQSSGNEYTSGKRANDGKTYSVIRTSISDEKVNKLLAEFVDDYNQTLSFIVCEQEHKQFIEAVNAGLVDNFTIAVGLRLSDKEDEDSEIRPEVNFLKGKSLRASVERETLEAQRAIAKAKARFFASGKADVAFSEQLAGDLQMKF